jgi:hypothetical protein
MFNYDDRLKDAGAVTATGVGQVSSSPKVVSLGAGLIRGNMIIDISAIKITALDEIYTLHLMGGNDALFTSEVSLASKEIGNKIVLQGNVDAKLSRLSVPFMNEERGIIYPFVRVRHEIAGTSPSINYVARLEKNVRVTGKTATVQGVTTTTTV